MPKNQRFDSRQYMKSSTYEIFRYKDDYPQNVSLHHHDFYEIYFFLAGNVQYNIESRSYMMTPGDVLLISPMELHQPVFTQGHRDYERIVLWINRQFLESLSSPGQDFTRCFDTTIPGHTNLLRPVGVSREYLTFLMEQIRTERSSQDPYHEVAAMTYLAQLLISLNRMALQNKGEGRIKAPDSAVYNVLNYINENYQEELTLDSLANRFFISKYHLSREFQRLIGTSVHRYIVQKRLAVAKQMLSDGVPSTEVYQHCGFGDYSNFYRAFKSEYQISPKEFVRRTKETDLHEEHLPLRLLEQLEK